MADKTTECEKARERLVALGFAAFEGKRDDNHAMTPPLNPVTPNNNFFEECSDSAPKREPDNKGGNS